MKISKALARLLLAGLMMVSLVACGGQDDEEAEGDTQVEVAPEDDAEDNSADDEAENADAESEDDDD